MKIYIYKNIIDYMIEKLCKDNKLHRLPKKMRFFIYNILYNFKSSFMIYKLYVNNLTDNKSIYMKFNKHNRILVNIKFKYNKKYNKHKLEYISIIRTITLALINPTYDIESIYYQMII